MISSVNVISRRVIDRTRGARSRGDEAVPKVLEHELARAPARVAVAAAAAGVDADHVALVDRERRDDRELLDRAVGPDHLGVVRRALEPARHAPTACACSACRRR